MHDAQAAVCREVDVEVVLVLAEVGSPDRAVVAPQSRSHGAPVDQVARMPDEQAWSVVEAGVGEIEVVADADGAGVRVVAAKDGIVVDGSWFGQSEGALRSGSDGDGGGGSIQSKASAGEHGSASLL